MFALVGPANAGGAVPEMSTTAFAFGWLAFMIVLFINKVSQDPVYHLYNSSAMSPSMKFSLLLGFVTLMAAPVVVGAIWSATWHRLSVEVRTSV